jgi:hypothetical protein
MRKNWPGTLMVVLALLAVPRVSLGSTLYGIEYSATGSGFYVVDQTMGALTLLGNTGNHNTGDLASDLVSTIWTSDMATDALLTINRATGAIASTTPIKDATGAPVDIVSLAWDPVTHVLYGNTSVGFGGTTADVLYQINASTGLATKIGTTIGFNQVYALGFNSAGTLYGISQTSNALITISTGTGSGSGVAPVSLTMAFDLAFRPEDDKMFVADTATESLYTMNPATGVAAPVGPYRSPINVVGLAFVSAPEPGTIALLIEGLGLLGWCARKRTRKK